MDTVSFAYHTVLEVGLRIEIAAGSQLAAREERASLPLTAGIQGRRARMVLNSIFGGVDDWSMDE
jgi:hypothetical protein